MSGRVCLVTGATAGIGEATALALARLRATVIVHGRDAARCERVVAEIREAADNPNVESVIGDFASLLAVRELAAELHRRLDRLHVLINNAGAMYPMRHETGDGIEQTLAVNHLAPFLLTNLLLDLLRAGAPARIVSVSSGAHRRASLDFDDLEARKDYEGRNVYGRSKLMTILFTRELAWRLTGSGVPANVLSPGLVHTEFGLKDGFGQDQQEIMDRGVSPEEGARTSLYLATSPEVAMISGGYFADAAPAELTEAARDEAAARRLWEVSARMTNYE